MHLHIGIALFVSNKKPATCRQVSIKYKVSGIKYTKYLLQNTKYSSLPR